MKHNNKGYTASHLADEPRDEQQHQNAVVISTMTEEGVRHERGKERYLSVGLSHFHFPQFHLNRLEIQVIMTSMSTLVSKV